jgi:23S rRNA (uracil1939-C5)-methyltransferase
MSLAPCKHFGVCGGCDSQDTEYAEQLKTKESALKTLFSQFRIKEFCSIVPSPRIFYHRNKMEYAVGSDYGIFLIGLRQKKKFYRIVDLEECRIFLKGVEDIFAIVKKWIGSFGIEPYQLRRHSGKIRYAAMRHSKYYNELMITIVLASEEEKISFLVDELKHVDNLKSIYLCINDKLSDVSLTDNLKLLYGQPYIKERINDIDYMIRPASFFQTNSYCCNELYSVIKKATASFGGRALDMCCGSGGITLQVAGNFDKVTGVDILAANIKDAAENARLNRIDNVEFIREDAEKFLLDLLGSKGAGGFSTIIVDPPRSGLSKKTKQSIADSGIKNVIYVSCNPRNLAEDLKVLNGSYDIEKIVPVDMFPHTRHAEIVAILKSNKV